MTSVRKPASESDKVDQYERGLFDGQDGDFDPAAGYEAGQEPYEEYVRGFKDGKRAAKRETEDA